MQRPQKNLCQECRYYYITWDADFPYGCKAIGFKSKQLPHLAVYQNSGVQCLAFAKKPPRNSLSGGAPGSRDGDAT